MARPAYNMRSRFFANCRGWLKCCRPSAEHSWFANAKSAWDEAPEKAANISPRTSAGAISAGALVRMSSPEFGEGVIVNIEGSGGNARGPHQFRQAPA